MNTQLDNQHQQIILLKEDNYFKMILYFAYFLFIHLKVISQFFWEG